MSRMTTVRLTRLALLLAISIVLGYFEYLVVVPVPLPGIKLGLANTIGLVLLFFFSWREYITISLLRVVFVALLLTGFGTAFLLSLAGMVASIVAVLYFRYVFDPSIYGLSMISAIFHGIGQIIVVSFLYKTALMVTYLPIMLCAGIISGYLVATLSSLVLVRLKKYQAA